MLYAFFCKITDRLKNNPSPIIPSSPHKSRRCKSYKGETKIFNITELKKH